MNSIFATSLENALYLLIEIVARAYDCNSFKDFVPIINSLFE